MAAEAFEQQALLALGLDENMVGILDGVMCHPARGAVIVKGGVTGLVGCVKVIVRGKAEDGPDSNTTAVRDGFG